LWSRVVLMLVMVVMFMLVVSWRRLMFMMLMLRSLVLVLLMPIMLVMMLFMSRLSNHITIMPFSDEPLRNGRLWRQSEESAALLRRMLVLRPCIPDIGEICLFREMRRRRLGCGRCIDRGIPDEERRRRMAGWGRGTCW
jgi:hypothetical protein